MTAYAALPAGLRAAGRLRGRAAPALGGLRSAPATRPAARPASRWSARPRCARSSAARRACCRRSPAHAFVTEVDGVTLVCPWRTRLRALEALEEFRADLPDEVLEAFVPRGAGRPARRRARALRAERPGAAQPRADQHLAGAAALVRAGRGRRARGQPRHRPPARRRGRTTVTGRSWSTGRRCRAPAGGRPGRSPSCAARSTTAPVTAGRRGPGPLARGVPPALAGRARLRRPGPPARRRRAAPGRVGPRHRGGAGRAGRRASRCGGRGATAG